VKTTALKFVLGGIALSLLGIAPRAAAHHSFEAEYDSNKPVTLVGTVTKFEWTNPHARFYVDVKDSQGNVENWNLELASPNVLTRQGWRRDSLKVGDQITVNAWEAKDGARIGNARTVTLADGRKVFAASAPEAGSK
jgi:Family of unknown function (DUF6152)